MGRQPNGTATASKPAKDTARGAAKNSARAATPGILHIVATPIGNARDITLRALDVLTAADLIACEDTRITGKFLSFHGIATPMASYHEHNAGRARPMLIERLKSGDSVALVSDAGTPLVSDPGYRLVEACVAEGIPLTTLPGASSVMAALTLAGLPTDRFMFAGFAPNKPRARRAFFAEVADAPSTLVFFESAKRLAASLADMADVFGPRPAAVLRELTKRFEEARRGALDELAAHYADAGAPKGEIVVTVGPPDERAATVSDADLDRLLSTALADGSLRDAVRRVAVETGLPRGRVYERAVALKDDG